ncbi:MAG: DNA-binding protein HU-beta [Mycoplasmataceae bacterium]|nr:MAG: DNA-binding protein HU-beta [Mycoplasmataceae bacterium]
MNKTELINSIATKAELNKKDTHKALDALLSSITDSLKKNKEVVLTGFGTFKVSHRVERPGFNPLTKLPILISASKTPSFKAGKTLKEAIK